MRPMPIQPISISLSSPSARFLSRLLHAPAMHGSVFYEPKDQAFDNETDGHDRKQSSEYICRVEQIAVFKNVPAEAAAPRRNAEHQFGRDQRAPGKCPADLEPGQNRWKCCWHENAGDIAETPEPEGLSRHT